MDNRPSRWRRGLIALAILLFIAPLPASAATGSSTGLLAWAAQSLDGLLSAFGLAAESGSNCDAESGSNLAAESGSNLAAESGSNLAAESGSNLDAESGSN